MKTGLSKREKFLIFIAAAALLVFASVKYGIEPLYHHYSDSMAKLDTLSIEKMMLELKLQTESLTRENHDEAEASFQEIERRYPVVMPNEEIDRILTGLCLQNNLSPASLKISDAVNFFAAQEKNAQDERGSQNEEKRDAAFVTVNATMLLSGDYRSLKRLIDAVEKIDYIRLERVSFLYGDGTANTSNVSVLFEITMRNDAPETETVA